jgi:hypothetical protein
MVMDIFLVEGLMRSAESPRLVVLEAGPPACSETVANRVPVCEKSVRFWAFGPKNAVFFKKNGSARLGTGNRPSRRRSQNMGIMEETVSQERLISRFL